MVSYYGNYNCIFGYWELEYKEVRDSFEGKSSVCVWIYLFYYVRKGSEADCSMFVLWCGYLILKDMWIIRIDIMVL